MTAGSCARAAAAALLFTAVSVAARALATDAQGASNALAHDMLAQLIGTNIFNSQSEQLGCA